MTTTLLPLLALAIIWVVHYLFSFLGAFSLSWVGVLFWAISSFGFGLSMSQRKKRSNTWVMKLVIAFVVFLLFTYQMGWIAVPYMASLRSSILIYFIYVWCGWAFFRD
ncbi:MAG: hypothetical protein GX775_05760 [Erysipelothrix sp.]|nr:hypothetical protein [Erysipelothrix sp.]